MPRRRGPQAGGMRGTARGPDARLFGAYFPRVFAYVQNILSDESLAKRITIDTFARVLERRPRPAEDEFRLAIFGLARELCLAERPPSAGPLSGRERDVISLLFDAQLARREVASLLELQEEQVTAELMRALKKLRGRRDRPGAPSFLKMT